MTVRVETMKVGSAGIGNQCSGGRHVNYCSLALGKGEFSLYVYETDGFRIHQLAITIGHTVQVCHRFDEPLIGSVGSSGGPSRR